MRVSAFDIFDMTIVYIISNGVTKLFILRIYNTILRKTYRRLQRFVYFVGNK